MKFIVLEEVDSTNSYVSAHSAELENMTMVTAHRQTTGRGQRGNSWESQEGKNLTFTLLFRPEDMKASLQFSISEATALAVVDYLEGCGVKAMVKWPNDVYVGDRKISGILIEHSVMGQNIDHSRIGVGLNINQLEFLSDAPNPVSLAQVTGKEYNLSHAAAALGAILDQNLQLSLSEHGRQLLHQRFKQNLWRGDGANYPFRKREDGASFQGEILDVAPSGIISIRESATGQVMEFAFKEVEFLLD